MCVIFYKLETKLCLKMVKFDSLIVITLKTKNKNAPRNYIPNSEIIKSTRIKMKELNSE